LNAIEQGDHAAAELLPLVYDELRMAAVRLAEEKPARRSSRPPWSTRRTSAWWAGTSRGLNGRSHFFAAAEASASSSRAPAAGVGPHGAAGTASTRMRLTSTDMPADHLLTLHER
jgi:hypothetical protein